MEEKSKQAAAEENRIEELKDNQLSEVTGGLAIPTTGESVMSAARKSGNVIIDCCSHWVKNDNTRESID